MGRAAKGEGSIFKTDAGWRGYITVNGRRKYASGAKKTEVAQKLRELKNQRDNGLVSFDRSPKLSAWIEHWIAASEGDHTIKTTAGYRQAVDYWMPAWLGDVTLSRLTVEHLEEAYASLRERKLSESTIVKLHNVIRGALSVAKDRGRIGANVATLVLSAPKADPEPVEPLSDADLEQIFKTLQSSRYEARWLHALELGPRPGESIALEWRHINFDEGSILVEQQLQMVEGKLRLVHYTKTEAGHRKLPLPGHVADAFKRHRDRQLQVRANSATWADWRDSDEKEDAHHAFVFTSARQPGQPLTPNGDAQQWQRILKAAGLPHTRRYVTRHTAASRMIASGLDLTVVAEILGHANIQTLVKVYAHAIEERKRAAAGLLEVAWKLGPFAPYVAPYLPDSARLDPTLADTEKRDAP